MKPVCWFKATLEPGHAMMKGSVILFKATSARAPAMAVRPAIVLTAMSTQTPVMVVWPFFAVCVGDNVDECGEFSNCYSLLLAGWQWHLKTQETHE